jgi:ankyrin repeat protein
MNYIDLIDVIEEKMMLDRAKAEGIVIPPEKLLGYKLLRLLNSASRRTFNIVAVIEETIKLIKEGANIYLLNMDGNNAMDLAIIAGIPLIIKIIGDKIAADKAAGISIPIRTPEQLAHKLFNALEKKNISAALHYIDEGADLSIKNMEYTALDVALELNLKPIIEAITDKIEIPMMEGRIPITGMYVAHLIKTNQFDRAARFISHPLFTDVNHIYMSKPPFTGSSPLLILSMQELYSAGLGRTDIPNILLDKGANIELTDRENMTPLMMAVNGHFPDLVTRLIGMGADMNKQTTDAYARTALSYACLRATDPGNPRHAIAESIALQLIHSGANIDITDGLGESALTNASKWLNKNIVMALLDRGIDVSKHSKALLYVCEKAVIDRRSPHLIAVAEEIALQLIHRGANIEITNRSGESPLIIACNALNKNIVTALLDRGANINKQTLDGNSALMYACNWLSRASPFAEEIIMQLIDRGANINITNIRGESVFSNALNFKNKNVIMALLDRGVEIDNIDISNAFFDIDLLQRLIDMGADMNFVNQSGITPIYYASRVANPAIVKMLLTDKVDPADPTLGRPSALSKLGTYSPEVQAIYRDFYKPKKLWAGFPAGDIAYFDVTLDTNLPPLQDQTLAVDPATGIRNIIKTKQMVFAQCPICMTELSLQGSTACNYVEGHNCVVEYAKTNRKLPDIGKLLYDKYMQGGAFEICILCSRICHGHKHHNLVPLDVVIRDGYNTQAEPDIARPGPIVDLDGDGYVGDKIPRMDNHWTADCRSLGQNIGGGLPEKIMRLHRFREEVKALEPLRGRIPYEEAWTRIIRAGWDAPINPSHDFKKEIKAEIKRNIDADAAARAAAAAAAAGATPAERNAAAFAAAKAAPGADVRENRFFLRTFNADHSYAFAGTIPVPEDVDDIIYRTIIDDAIYKYPDVIWTDETTTQSVPIDPANSGAGVHTIFPYHPTLVPGLTDDPISMDSTPCGVIFTHRQTAQAFIKHDPYPLQRIFIGDGFNVNDTEVDLGMLSLRTRNRNGITSSNFGMCFVCTKRSVSSIDFPPDGICKVDPGFIPCRSKLYPQELQMALDLCTFEPPEEFAVKKAEYQRILDEYRSKFNKLFASPDEKERGHRKEKSAYLKHERPRVAAARAAAAAAANAAANRLTRNAIGRAKAELSANARAKENANREALWAPKPHWSNVAEIPDPFSRKRTRKQRARKSRKQNPRKSRQTRKQRRRTRRH